MRWPWQRNQPDNDGAAERAREQEWKLRKAQAESVAYERLARLMDDLPADEFAARVRAAFRRPA